MRSRDRLVAVAVGLLAVAVSAEEDRVKRASPARGSDVPAVVVGQVRYEEDRAYPGYLFVRSAGSGELLYVQQVFRQRRVAGREEAPVFFKAMRSDSPESLVIDDDRGRTHRVSVREKERGSHWPASVELVSSSPLTVRLTVPNPGMRPLALDGPSVCEGGRLENAVFQLEVDGRAVPYAGKMAKRAPPDTFITVKPGKTHTVEVDLSKDFKLPAKGSLVIRFETFNHFSKDELQLVSNELVLER